MAYNKLMLLEGYYLKDVDGRTYCGITEKNYPDCPIWPLVDKEEPLSRNQKLKNPSADSIVQVFYYQNYWQGRLFGNINDQNVCNFIFCQYVNGGYHAIMIAQQATDTKLRVDGVFGSKTLIATNETDAPTMINRMKELWTMRYKSIANNNPSKANDLSGWLDRINILS